MNFSAASSSSPVVTPGRTLPSSSLRVRTRMSPAAAILSISSGVLRMIMWRVGPLDLFLEPQCGEGGPDVVVHLRRRAAAVEALQDAALVVEVDERLGLLPVGLQALADGLGLVVVALDELGPVDVADALV